MITLNSTLMKKGHNSSEGKHGDFLLNLLLVYLIDSFKVTIHKVLMLKIVKLILVFLMMTGL